MSICYMTFEDCGSLSSVTIGNGVKSIGDSAFWGCAKLISVALPESITSISSYAFAECKSLISVVIPECVASIGEDAFESCKFFDVDGVTEITDYTKLPGYKYVGDSPSKLIRHELYNVLFDENGGSVKVKRMIVNEGDEFILPEYAGTKTGYIFDGWSFEGKVFQAGTAMTKVSGDMKFTAVWKPVKYKAVFMNGSEVFSSETYDYGTKIIAPAEIPAKKSTAEYDYIFKEWKGYKDGMIITGDITFDAMFKANIKDIDTSGKKVILDTKDVGEVYASSEIIDKIISAGKEGKGTEILLSDGKIFLDNISAAGLPSGEKEISFIDTDRSKIPASLKERIGDRPVYSINFGDVHEFSGVLTISVKYELKDGEKADDLCIWCLKSDGTYEKISCRYSDGYAVFDTTHLSDYAVMIEGSEPTPSENEFGYTGLIVAGAIAEMIIIIVAALLMIRKKSE